MKNSGGSKILMVGASGFLGMEVCRQLIAAKKNVFGLVGKTAGQEKVKALKHSNNRNHEKYTVQHFIRM